MKKQDDNRRVRMTKRLMKDALLELMEQNASANISVTALCKAADVHRSTFYNYYSEPADLLREIEQEFLDRIPIPNQIPDPEDPEQLLAANTAFFDYIKENAGTFRILFNEETGSSFTSRLIQELCCNYIPTGKDIDEPAAGFIRVYIANGTVGMLREWINTGFPISSSTIAEMMYYLSRKIAY